MKKNDFDLIAEAYEQIQEGLFDRLKARGSQAVGAVKGAGQQVAGKVQQAAGAALNKAAEVGGQALGVDASKGTLATKGSQLAQAGKKQIASGQRAGNEAKYSSYIQNSAQTIATDLAKLGMSVSDEAALVNDLKQTIQKHLTQVTKGGQFRTTKGTIGSKVV